MMEFHILHNNIIAVLMKYIYLHEDQKQTIMKKTFLPVLMILLLVSCKPAETNLVDENISQVESGLLPAVITNKDSLPEMNIYDRMDYYKVPGVSIAVINDGKIEWAKGYGYFTYDTIHKIDASTRFQAASISKPVAAFAALTFVQEGLLDLDRDVNQDLKSWQVPGNKFTAEEKVTLRRLISHTAGLTVHGFGGYAFDNEVPSIVQVLNGENPANSDPILPDTIPGAIYRYSGGGFTVMQLLLCDISGKSFPEIMEERVLSKIEMNNSTYLQPLPDALSAFAAVAHRSDGSPIAGNWHTYPEMAAAGLWTTPTDLAKFAIELYESLAGESNLILSQEMVEQMLTEEKDGYGLGIGLGGKNDSIRFGHGGSNEGFKCNMIFYSKLGKGAVIMTNGDQGGILVGEIFRAISETYNWDIYKPKYREISYPGSDALQEYTGTFEFEPGYSAIVTVSGNSVIIKQLWDEQEYHYWPEKKDTFFSKRSDQELVFKRNEEEEIIEFELAGTWTAKKVTNGQE